MKSNRLINRPAPRRPLGKRLGKAIQRASFLVFVSCMFFTASGAMSLLFVALYQYLLVSPYFRLTEIVFEGADPELRKELVQMAGLDVDVSLLALDLPDIKQRMEIHPWVKCVELKRRFPSRLQVAVERRIPLALIGGASVYYVDHRGEIFKELEPGEDTSYPVITGLSEDRDARLRQISSALGLLRVLNQASLGGQKVAEINMRAGGQVSIFLEEIKVEIRSSIGGLSAKLKGP